MTGDKGFPRARARKIAAAAVLVAGIAGCFKPTVIADRIRPALRVAVAVERPILPTDLDSLGPTGYFPSRRSLREIRDIATKRLAEAGLFTVVNPPSDIESVPNAPRSAGDTAKIAALAKAWNVDAVAFVGLEGYGSLTVMVSMVQADGTVIWQDQRIRGRGGQDESGGKISLSLGSTTKKAEPTATPAPKPDEIPAFLVDNTLDSLDAMIAFLRKSISQEGTGKK